jgi:glutamate N-acetyltransferase/amino-acid N-acetyltransferase
MFPIQPAIDGIAGFKASGVHCGYKKDGALDFALIYSEHPCVAAGVFTTNLVKAAPVLVDIERLETNNTQIRAVIINTRCANACTGQQGIDNALLMTRWTAERLGIAEEEVLVMSTGVIGTQLDMDKIRRGVDLAVDALADGETAWMNAAAAIMTTDTRPKAASVLTDFRYKETAGYQYHIGGIAKGAGMIAPNMATMLGLIVTDSRLGDPAMAHSLLFEAAEQSFNSISVDGDTSTNDTLLLLANGASADPAVHYDQFNEFLGDVCLQLAVEIVRDGEGATKFIEIAVQGAQGGERQIANTIATSPLVKTAFYGGDPNWGRIVAAAGRAGVPVDPAQMRLWIKAWDADGDGLLLFENGVPTDYDEAHAKAIMAQADIRVRLDCGMGGELVTVYTCDISHDYVSINGHYRT